MGQYKVLSIHYLYIIGVTEGEERKRGLIMYLKKLWLKTTQT